MKVSFARSATKHRISRPDSQHVVESAGKFFRFREISPRREPRALFLGDDPAGRPLEVIAVLVGEEDFLIIHAMPMRTQFQTRYEEAKRWRKSD